MAKTPDHSPGRSKTLAQTPVPDERSTTSSTGPQHTRAATPLPSGGAGRPSGTSLDDYLDDQATAISPGVMVGEYEVTGKLGEGGMGEVYAAVHPVIGKKVAIKVLADHVAANRDVVRRFVAEARAVNQIGHPNIVDVFSFGQLNDGREYYVMEHLSGRSLEDELEERLTLPADEAVDILEQVLDALQAAHDERIIHRDLKPDNIFLVEGRRGRKSVKLLDFGIAKLSGDEAGLTKTRTGMAMGTPDYMSPEQCRGSQVDHRTDIYALGVILYRLFTGRFPFRAETAMELFVKHLHEDPPAPSSIVQLPAAFEDIILKCLAKQPDDRFDSARELAEALERACDDTGEMRGPAPVVVDDSEPDDVTVRPSSFVSATPVSATDEQAGAPVAAPATARPSTSVPVLPEPPAGFEAGNEAGLAPPENPAATRPVAPARAKRRSAVLYLAIMLLAASVAVAVLMLFSRSDQTRSAVAVPVDAGNQVAAAAAPDARPTPPDAAPIPVPEPEPATLVIKTNLADAEVLVDGKPVGRGRKVEIADLEAIPYLVTVRRARYQTEEIEVKLQAGEQTVRVVKLKREKRVRPNRGGSRGDKGSNQQGDSKRSGKDSATERDAKPDPIKDKDSTIDVFERSR